MQSELLWPQETRRRNTPRGCLCCPLCTPSGLRMGFCRENYPDGALCCLQLLSAAVCMAKGVGGNDWLKIERRIRGCEVWFQHPAELLSQLAAATERGRTCSCSMPAENQEKRRFSTVESPRHRRGGRGCLRGKLVELCWHR